MMNVMGISLTVDVQGTKGWGFHGHMISDSVMGSCYKLASVSFQFFSMILSVFPYYLMQQDVRVHFDPFLFQPWN